MNDKTVFDTRLVKVLLGSQKYSNQLTFKVFIPWVVYWAVTLFYMDTIAVDYSKNLKP